jgi:hypothetical protein
MKPGLPKLREQLSPDPRQNLKPLSKAESRRCHQRPNREFDADTTFRDWVMAFQHIGSLSADAEGDCVWSAPSHPKDMKPADWKRLDSALERARAKFLETGDFDVKEGDWI